MVSSRDCTTTRHRNMRKKSSQPLHRPRRFPWNSLVAFLFYSCHMPRSAILPRDIKLCRKLRDAGRIASHVKCTIGVPPKIYFPLQRHSAVSCEEEQVRGNCQLTVINSTAEAPWSNRTRGFVADATSVSRDKFRRAVSGKRFRVFVRWVYGKLPAAAETSHRICGRFARI